MSYIDLHCRRGYRDECGAPVHLIVTEVRDAYKDLHEGETWTHEGETWTRTTSTWRLECDEGHILATSDDLYEGNDYPPLPTVRFAQWDVSGIEVRHTVRTAP